MGKDKKKQLGVLGLIVALMIVLIGGLIFVGAVAGWFDDPKVVISEEYLAEEPRVIEVSAGGYKDVINEKKSFILFVDQNGCVTAERLKGYLKDYTEEKGISTYEIMFEEVKKTSLHDFVKYYPSVVVFDKGEVKYYLRADSNEDADMYNDYEAFKGWLDKKIEISSQES